MLQELLEEEAELEHQWQKGERDIYINLSWSSGPQDTQKEGMAISRHIVQDTRQKQNKAAVNNSWTRTSKAKTQKHFTKANSEVKNSARTDKRKYVDSLTEEAEEASNNIMQVYDITKKLSGKCSRTERPIKDKEGNTVQGTEQQLNRWAENPLTSIQQTEN